MSDQPKKQELPPFDVTRECTYCGTPNCDHKHGNGHACCANCCATHGGMATNEEEYIFVRSIVANKNRIVAMLLAALSDNEALRANPKVADCSICGASIFASNERITEDGRTYHPICAVRADNEAKDARIADLETECERHLTRAFAAEGEAAFKHRRADAAEAKLKSVEGLLDENLAVHGGWRLACEMYAKAEVDALFARIREAVKGDK